MLHHRHFYMIRHGQSEHNANKLMAGHIDTPLTQTGRDQAAHIRDLIPILPHRPTHIIHSPLTRAKNTAEILNQDLQCPMIADKNLKELHMGNWENQSVDLYIDRFLNFENPENGETFDDFQRRITHAIATQINQLPHPAIPVIVSHGGVMRAFFKQYHKTVKRIGNCRLYEFRPQNQNTDHPFPWDIFEHYQDSTGEIISQKADDLFL